MPQYKLINIDSFTEIKVGDTVTTFRGEKYVLAGFRYMPPPSSGRVTLKLTDGFTTEYYPSVIGAKIVEV